MIATCVPMPTIATPTTQASIYHSFFELAKTEPPASALAAFRDFFLYATSDRWSDLTADLFSLLFNQESATFHYTLKRCCYILVNNWEIQRCRWASEELVQILTDPVITKSVVSPLVKRLRQGLQQFTKSTDFHDLRLIALRHRKLACPHWSNQYTAYLLAPQYLNSHNPSEQREAARYAANQIKTQFKFDLAMYTARSQRALANHPSQAPTASCTNPTALGDETLNLVKRIVAKQGGCSYRHWADLFLKQVKTMSYSDFKQALQRYLILINREVGLAKNLTDRLAHLLENLYVDYNDQPVTDALLARTCNRLVEWLTTTDRTTPSLLFLSLLVQGQAFTLVILLLKILLVCEASRSHIELQIARLIQYYEPHVSQDCESFIHFLEIYRLVMTIFSEDVQYSLISLFPGHDRSPNVTDLQRYRIFSQRCCSSAKTSAW